MTFYTLLNLIKYVFLEKPRRIDFSRSDFSYSTANSPENYYSRTDHSTLKQLVSSLNLNENDSFLDIGCGKGAVIYFFAKHTSANICGIEKYEGLAQIARNNFRTLNMENRVNILTCDARAFSHYNDFNYFFLFNPFKAEVAEEVLNKIVSSRSCRPRTIRIISVQPFLNEQIISAGFQKKSTIVSKLTGVGTFVFEL